MFDDFDIIKIGSQTPSRMTHGTVVKNWVKVIFLESLIILPFMAVHWIAVGVYAFLILGLLTLGMIYGSSSLVENAQRARRLTPVAARDDLALWVNDANEIAQKLGYKGKLNIAFAYLVTNSATDTPANRKSSISNAFAITENKRSGWILVSPKLINASPAARRGVLAHEIMHLVAKDGKLRNVGRLASVVATIIAAFYFSLGSVFFALAGLPVIMVIMAVNSLLLNAVYRYGERRADRASLKIEDANVLEFISLVMEENEKIGFTVDLKDLWWKLEDIFVTHPSLANRQTYLAKFIKA